MKRASRAKFVAGAAGAYAAFGIQRYPAGAAELTYKLSTDVPNTHPMGARAVEAAAKITQGSGGRLEVRVFPNSTLGGQAQQVANLRLGAIEFGLCFDAITEGSVRAAGISSVPFAFSSHKAYWDAMDGPLGKFVHGAIDKLGLYTFSKAWDVGFRDLENSLRPVKGPDDAKGLKLRVSDSPVEVALFKSWGATPTVVNGSEQYSALQSHLADGTGVPIAVIDVRKMYEVVKYISLTHHMITGYTFIANGPAWQKLPKDIQALCDRSFNEAGQLCSDDFVKADVTERAALEGHGCVFNEVDLAAFKSNARTNGLYKQWRDYYGADAWRLLEASVGQLV